MKSPPAPCQAPDCPLDFRFLSHSNPHPGPASGPCKSKTPTIPAGLDLNSTLRSARRPKERGSVADKNLRRSWREML